MKAHIAGIIGGDQVARIEARAAARGIPDIWDRAAERAKAELPEADQETLAGRAAKRAAQIVGLLPRVPLQAPVNPTPTESPIPAPSPASPADE